MLKRYIILIYLALLSVNFIWGCTSAIIGADLNPYGRPLLWKNRDTGTFDNKVEYINGNNGEFSYVALYNSKDSLLNEAWMGMNEFGFAIMNTASYNLKNDNVPQKDMDKEGLVMTEALRKCKTIKDFQNLLDTISKPMGVEANFGVIDAYGDGAYFETDNYKYKIFYLSDTPDNILVRTNYSHSGRDNEGFGFIRENNANHLLEPYINNKNVTPEVLTEELSKSFYHSLLDKDFTKEPDQWVIDQDFIPRYTSTASIVIEGCRPLAHGEELNPDFLSDQYTMWTAMGYPPCAEIFPVFCKEEGVPTVLTANPLTGRSDQCDRVMERKNEVFPFTKGNGNKYINFHKLYNDEGTGYIQKIKPLNIEIYNSTRALRDR